MVFARFLLLAIGSGLILGAIAIIVYDVRRAIEHRNLLAAGAPTSAPHAVRLRLAATLTLLAILPLLLANSIVVIPSGSAGVRVSQFSGTRPGTLEPGVHFIAPLVSSVALFDTRDRVYLTVADPLRPESKAEARKPEESREVMRVQAREGLPIGLAIAVRFRLDTKRLDYIHANLPQPVDVNIVAPAIASTFRDLAPQYTVREIFAAKRDELRQRAADTLTKKLAADGILVKEVALRDLVLPVEYSKGLEGILLKEQESERLAFEIEIKQKQVRTAELEAEAHKLRQVKQAEAEAQVRVLQAKGEADAMQHTLPLKQKQIEQSRLEAEARKEATLKNAEAAAQAKIIDSKAELERRKYFAEAEANRIRVTSAADAERMKLEALVLKQNPLLIQKIVAEKLSDKIQVMMVPTDGKYFFANDVMRSTLGMGQAAQDEDPPAPRPTSGNSNNHSSNGNGRP